MLFNTSLFLGFFIVFFLTYQFALTSARRRLWFIFLGSCLFYAAWNWRFVFLLLGTGLLDFWVALAIAASAGQRRKKWLLALSLVANLAVLAIFKYANFFLGNVYALLSALGVSSGHPAALDLILPVGVSFYTFQSMSYTIDVYRGTFAAKKNPLEFLASLTFFPHLVAGPIIRSSYLIPQFQKLESLPWQDIRHGFLLIGWGLAKKTIADLLAVRVEAAFAPWGPPECLGSWIGALAFAGQIYGDFSGYTDIAIGVAALLGFSIPDNFNLPYLSTSIIAFWRRWHISLSSWLRDYLYFSLGGGRRHRLVNLMITMLLGGLWHGASWTFVIWGGYHGALLVLSHVLGMKDGATSALGRCGKILFTFYLVLIGWVLFRAPTLGVALSVLRAMHHPSGFASAPAQMPALVLVILGLVVPHQVDYLMKERRAAVERSWVLWPLAAIGLGFCLAFGAEGHAFIYFQF